MLLRRKRGSSNSQLPTPVCLLWTTSVLFPSFPSFLFPLFLLSPSFSLPAFCKHLGVYDELQAVESHSAWPSALHHVVAQQGSDSCTHFEDSYIRLTLPSSLANVKVLWENHWHFQAGSAPSSFHTDETRRPSKERRGQAGLGWSDFPAEEWRPEDPLLIPTKFQPAHLAPFWEIRASFRRPANPRECNKKDSPNPRRTWTRGAKCLPSF